jgi:Uma2 family endonuclease
MENTGVLNAYEAPRFLEKKGPPLESGDRLTREEFEFRYSERPDIHKAELIDGVAYVASPVCFKTHGQLHSDIMAWLGAYRAATPKVWVADNTTLRLDADNEVQPDALVWIDRKDGCVRVTDDDYLEGSPELIVEIAASSASYDLHDKLHVYRRNRVQEYLVLLAYEKKALWHVWVKGEYQALEPDTRGVLCSQVFPGLHFQPSLFWAGDLSGVLKVLQEGLKTSEHAAFVHNLEQS